MEHSKAYNARPIRLTRKHIEHILLTHASSSDPLGEGWARHADGLQDKSEPKSRLRCEIGEASFVCYRGREIEDGLSRSGCWGFRHGPQEQGHPVT